MSTTMFGARFEAIGIQHVTARLIAFYADRLPAETVEQVIADIDHGYADGPAHGFVPLLVERAAREALDELSELPANDR